MAEPTAGVAAGFDGAGNKATARVLAVVAAFTGGAATLGVSELSRQLGMTKSMVHRALATLLDEGYVVRDPSGNRYQLGYRVLEFAGSAGSTPELPELCAPYMREMFEITGETVTLAARRGRHAVTIDGIQGRGAIARRVPIGRFVPLHISAAARVILGFLTDDDIAEYLRSGDLLTVTPTSLATPDQVWQDVRRTREQGYAYGLFDNAPNAFGVAFPVLDQADRPHGSVTVVGPKDRLTAERLDRFMPDLVGAAARLNRHSRLYRSQGDGEIA
jgi:IclR family KDG regulon transcriptional repressor